MILPAIKVPSNKCNFSSSFAQFSSFLYFFFSQEVVQYLSNDLLVSFMGISPFLSLIYHTQNTINTETFSISHHKSGGLVARFSSAAREGGVQFPAWVVKAFICLISQQQTSVEKFHRYLYIKYICDVIIQYLGD